MRVPDFEIRSPAPTPGPRAQRKRALLVEAALTTFLDKGYGGTRIDDIAQAAGVARSGFYTYFPSKRDVLLAVGAESAQEVALVLAGLDDLTTGTPAQIRAWIVGWFDYLDRHGRFLLVWGQASSSDEELRKFGLRTHLRTARKIGEALVRLGHRAPVQASDDALALLGAMERLWYYESISSGAIDRDEMIDTATRLWLASVAERPKPVYQDA